MKRIHANNLITEACTANNINTGSHNLFSSMCDERLDFKKLVTCLKVTLHFKENKDKIPPNSIECPRNLIKLPTLVQKISFQL